MEKQYYIEIYNKIAFGDKLLVESKWFRTKEAAIKWFKDSFGYHNKFLGARLLSVSFDENGDYNEIEDGEELSW